MSDVFGIVLCSSCGRKRIADLRHGTSACPYCNKVTETSELKILFGASDQSKVRRAFSDMDGDRYPLPKKRTADDPDPLSTLVYTYEHTTGAEEKLTVLAEGLTRIKGCFDGNDLEELFPGTGEQLMRMMISADIVIEIKTGTFRIA
jgi:hypothetical protein